MTLRTLSIAGLCALALAGCHKKPAETAAANETATVETTNAAAPAAPDAAAPPAAAPAGPAFDVTKVPVSGVALGAFPYLSLPTGYKARSEKTLDMARYPVWVGDRFEWVEGKVYDAGITNDEGKDYSAYEVKKNIEALVQQAGGVKITDQKPGNDAMQSVSKERQTFDDSVNDLGDDTVETFLIHQKDRDIWIQFATSDGYGAWGIVEAKPFVASAKLLPAGAPADAPKPAN